jgi:hypothetical protein
MQVLDKAIAVREKEFPTPSGLRVVYYFQEQLPENLLLQYWRASSNVDHVGSLALQHPAENSVVVFFFAETNTRDDFGYESGRDGWSHLPTHGYVTWAFRNGVWAPFLAAGLDIESCNQWKLRANGLEFQSKPRGVIDHQVMVDYLAGLCSVTDLIQLEWRLGVAPKLEKALEAITGLKDAMGGSFRSSRAAEAQKLLEDILRHR